MEITADYSLYGRLTNIFPEYEVKITDTVFEKDVTVKLLCTVSDAAPLEEKLIDAANGRITIQKGEESFEDFA